MQLSQSLLGVALLCITTFTPLVADDPKATVREQVQQERTVALDRLSRLRDRMDKIQLRLEQLDIEKIVEQRLQQSDKQSVTDELKEITASVVPTELDQADSSLELLPSKEKLPDSSRAILLQVPQDEFQPPVAYDQLSFRIRAIDDTSSYARMAFDLKRRFFEARTDLGNKQRLFNQKIIARAELQRAQNEYKLATEAIENLQSQISEACLIHEKLLEGLNQERALGEQQVAYALTMLNNARGTQDEFFTAKRELLQLQEEEINLRGILAKLRELAKIVKDRDEEDTSPKSPAATETNLTEK